MIIHQQKKTPALFTIAKTLFIFLIVFCWSVKPSFSQSVDTLYLKVGDIIPGKLISDFGVSPIIFKTQSGFEMEIEGSEVKMMSENGIKQNVRGENMDIKVSTETNVESQSNTLRDHQSPQLDERTPGRFSDRMDEPRPGNRPSGGKRSPQETFP